MTSTWSGLYAASVAIGLVACGVNVAEPIGARGGLASAGAAGNGVADGSSRDLAAYWKLDEPDAAATAVDSANASPDLSAAPVNGPLPSTQVPQVRFEDPASRSFDGQQQYLLVKDSAQLDFADEITLAAWVNVTALNDTCQYIVGHGYCLDPPGEVVLRIGSTTCGPGGAPHYWAVGSWLLAEHSAIAAIDERDLGTWVHLVGTYDGEAWHLYRNGAEIATQASSVGAVPVRSDWAIGARAPGVPPCVPAPAERFFNGSIDDVRIYRRALDASEVEELYHR